MALCATGAAAQTLDRTVLPLPEPKRPLYNELDARKAKMPAPFEVKAPKGAPNVVIVLIDDLGFGATSTFGDPVPTKALDQLAREGLRYNNFHTTSLSLPTRAALKSGRKPRHDLAEDVWELYDTRSDFSLVNNLATQNPKKLKELQALFMKEARKYHVLPIDDRVFERLDGEAVGRPDLMAGRTSLTLAEGMTGMMESVFINVKNRSKTITAEVEVPEAGANGTVIAQGGRFGGWSLYVKEGVPAYGYNFLGLQRSSIVSSKKLESGKAELSFQFDYDNGGPGKGGKVRYSSTARRSARGGSSTRRAACSRQMKPLMWASTWERQLSKPSGRRRSHASPDASRRSPCRSSEHPYRA